MTLTNGDRRRVKAVLGSLTPDGFSKARKGEDWDEFELNTAFESQIYLDLFPHLERRFTTPELLREAETRMKEILRRSLRPDVIYFHPALEGSPIPNVEASVSGDGRLTFLTWMPRDWAKIWRAYDFPVYDTEELEK